MATTLSAGTAAATITPERPMQLQGYDRGPSTGTLDPLETRAIVFDDGSTQAAIVTADLIGLEYAFEGPECASVHRIRASAAAASGVPEDNIMVACSHTHASPSVQRLSHLPEDDEYQRTVEQTLGAVVGEASRAMQPVTLGVGEGMVDINVNRRLRTPDGNTAMRPNRQGIVDKRVRVLRVDPASAPAPVGTLGSRPLPQSDPLAVLFSYVCHATTLGGDNYRFSADYPGSARRVVEGVYQANGGAGAKALFLPGCFGNIRPHPPAFRRELPWRHGSRATGARPAARLGGGTDGGARRQRAGRGDCRRPTRGLAALRRPPQRSRAAGGRGGWAAGWLGQPNAGPVGTRRQPPDDGHG